MVRPSAPGGSLGGELGQEVVGAPPVPGRARHLLAAELVAKPGQGHPAGGADRAVEVAIRRGVDVDRRLAGRVPTVAIDRGLQGQGAAGALGDDAAVDVPDADGPDALVHAARHHPDAGRQTQGIGGGRGEVAHDRSRSDQLGQPGRLDPDGVEHRVPPAVVADVVEQRGAVDAAVGHEAAREPVKDEVFDQQEAPRTREQRRARCAATRAAWRPSRSGLRTEPRCGRRRPRPRSARSAPEPRPGRGCRARRGRGPAVCRPRRRG